MACLVLAEFSLAAPLSIYVSVELSSTDKLHSNGIQALRLPLMLVCSWVPLTFTVARSLCMALSLSGSFQRSWHLQRTLRHSPILIAAWQLLATLALYFCALMTLSVYPFILFLVYGVPLTRRKFVCSCANRIDEEEGTRQMPTFHLAAFGSPPKRYGSACPVCLEEFDPNMDVAYLPCNHVFHVECIHSWLRSRDRCPLRCSNDVEAQPAEALVCSVRQPAEAVEETVNI